MRKKLLLADDSVTIQRVIELTFADEDIDVIAVGDGAAAIARLDSDPPDVVLADIGMPGRDGYEVALHVHRTPTLTHIPVVLLTGAFQPVNERKAMEAGCAGVLVKPFEPQMLIARVQQLLNRGAESPAASIDLPSAEESKGAPSANPPAGAAEASHSEQTLDDYFARLDAAFASLNVPPESTPAASRRSEAAARDHVPSSHEREPGSGPAVDAARHHESTRRNPTLADAFTALLALEQGSEPPALPEPWPSAIADVVDEITRRVTEQVTDRVVRQLAPEIVSQVAERVVRDEIDRLRRQAESS
jgi:CheY-like chemotaxis protein